MEHQPNLRALATWMVLAIAVASCGQAESDTATTLDGSVPHLFAEADGITIDGSDVPNGSSQAVEFDQEIALADQARGRLVLEDVEFELYMKTNLSIVASDRLDVLGTLELGHVTGSVDDDADVRVRLETPSGVVLTIREPGTEFAVCQSAEGKTCLDVVKGEVEWQSAGQTKTYVTGQSSFGAEGDPPQPAVCVPPDAFDRWFAGARRNEESRTLGELVNESPLCDDGPPGTTVPSDEGAAEQRSVPGTVAWTDTGIDVRSGELVSIEAGGEIQAGVDRVPIGPDGERDPNLRAFNLPELPEANHAALIGRVGEAGPPFLVGPIRTASADRDGRLFLGINDAGVDNNSGAFDVTITVSSP